MVQLATLLEKLSNKLLGWVEAFVIMLPNLTLALLAVALAVPVSRWARAFAAATFGRLTKSPPIANLAATLVRVMILILALSFALELLQLDKTVTSLIAGVGVVGLALGFAFQDIASNLMSGFMLAMTRPFDIGDLVEISSHTGRIQVMSMRDTEMETVDGRSVLIPNREVFQNAIVNYTRTPSRRLEFSIGIDYDEELEAVRDAMVASLESLPGRIAEEPIEVLYAEFGETTIKAQVLVWLNAGDEEHYRRSRSTAMIAVKRALDQRGVVLPVPQRTVELGPYFKRHDVSTALK
jgi:small conductance mechanosensitive channel